MPVEPSPLDDALAQLVLAPDYVQHNGNLCPIAKIMQTVSSETAERLRFLIDETRKPGSMIADTLTASGYPISGQSVQRHRRRLTRPSAGCKCS